MTIQKENIEKLLKLIKENPELEIVPMVHTEVVGDSDLFTMWKGKWSKVKIDEYYEGDEKIYFSDDFNDLVDEFIEDGYANYHYLNDKELKKLAKVEVRKYNWKKAIIVNIVAN